MLNWQNFILDSGKKKLLHAFRRKGSGSDGLNGDPNHCPLAVAIHRWLTITSSKALSSCHCKPHWEQWQAPTVPSLADGSQAALDESQADKANAAHTAQGPAHSMLLHPSPYQHMTGLSCHMQTCIMLSYRLAVQVTAVPAEA